MCVNGGVLDPDTCNCKCTPPYYGDTCSDREFHNNYHKQLCVSSFMLTVCFCFSNFRSWEVRVQRIVLLFCRMHLAIYNLLRPCCSGRHRPMLYRYLDFSFSDLTTDPRSMSSTFRSLSFFICVLGWHLQ